MDYILVLILCLLFVYGRRDVIFQTKINKIVAPLRRKVRKRRPTRNCHTQTESMDELSKEDALPSSTTPNVSNVTLVTSDSFTIVEPNALKNEDNHVQTYTVHSLESKDEVLLSDRDATIKTDEAMSIADGIFFYHNFTFQKKKILTHTRDS
ncbi:hypothetical protein HMI56_004598 [Coelomomyces lativittatus]|nr:hypothetical protein HMI56_004598 [Coelomomyces lativittatus]